MNKIFYLKLFIKFYVNVYKGINVYYSSLCKIFFVIFLLLFK